MSNSTDSDYVGEILCYGFVEDKNRWHYKKMYGIHPSNFDLTQPLETYRF
ncbi:hypothetical protein D910_02106 [Dendroctonus ponderosae]|uniref:Uncharacterized protein n=1 Tax=Dendroctonus ponderosae TaxID=77166 RepID=U4TT28_DENPD|nr:hypothetical protein D910_02106 [Dendroctonus ponderosae]